MAHLSRPVHSGTFLVTSVTADRKSLFQVERHADLFLETLQHYRREGYYRLHAFVVMPNHIHLLTTPTGITLERSMQLIKGGFSHRLVSKFPVWQRGFDDRRMRNREEFVAAKDYIHQNPVEAKLVCSPDEYRWSSAWVGLEPATTSGAEAQILTGPDGTAEAVP